MQPVRDAGLAVETVVAHGSTFIEVIRAAIQRQHDLVIKTVSSEGIFHRTFFGSIDMHLLRKCPTPLWLIKPGEPEAFRQILVPLDPNMEDSIKYGLGINLLTLATSLAEVDGAELMIVHAWRAYEEGKLKKYMESKQFEEYLHRWGQELRSGRGTSSPRSDAKSNRIRFISFRANRAMLFRNSSKITM